MAQHAQEDTIDEVGEEGEPELPLKQKVAIVMVAMGEEVSGEVMKHLSDYEIEEITQAIAGLKNVSVDIMDRLLEEFEQHIMAGEWISQGGLDFARQICSAATKTSAVPRSSPTCSI
jgi:flagellar motor switch protein FliG